MVPPPNGTGELVNRPPDQLPPHNDELETDLLAAILLDQRTFALVRHRMSPRLFYRNSSRLIFEAAAELHDQGHGVDAFATAALLDRRDVLEQCGGRASLMLLAVRLPSGAGAPVYLEQLERLSQQRRLLQLGCEIEVAVHRDEDPDVTAQDVVAQLSELRGTGSRGVRVADDAQRWFEEFTARARGEKTLTHSTGNAWLDWLLDGGISDGHSYYVGGLAKIGKSKLLIELGEPLLDQGYAVDWWSVEMSEDEIETRLVSAHTRARESHLTDPARPVCRKANIEKNAVEGAAWLKGIDLRLFYEGSPYVEDIALETAARAAEAARAGKRYALFVDYVQECTTTDRHKRGHERIEHCSRVLNGLSKNLRIPVFIAYQLSSYKVEGRGGEKLDYVPPPRPSDGHGSSQIQKDANHLIMIHRPWYEERGHRSRFTIIDRGLSRGGGGRRQLYMYADLDRNRFEPWYETTPPPFKPLEDMEQFL